jgi:hypothetical protein
MCCVPSRPPESFTLTPLSTNLARSKAFSFRDIPRLCVQTQGGGLLITTSGCTVVHRRLARVRLYVCYVAKPKPSEAAVGQVKSSCKYFSCDAAQPLQNQAGFVVSEQVSEQVVGLCP